MSVFISSSDNKRVGLASSIGAGTQEFTSKNTGDSDMATQVGCGEAREQQDENKVNVMRELDLCIGTT